MDISDYAGKRRVITDPISRCRHENPGCRLDDDIVCDKSLTPLALNVLVTLELKAGWTREAYITIKEEDKTTVKKVPPPTY